MGMLEGLLGGGIGLIIINLFVRDRSEFKVGRMRTELMLLRSDEKRQAERRKEIDKMAAELEEAVERAGRRAQSAKQDMAAVEEQLRQLHIAVHGTELLDEQLKVQPQTQPDDAVEDRADPA